jgi:hypothetical protein
VSPPFFTPKSVIVNCIFISKVNFVHGGENVNVFVACHMCMVCLLKNEGGVSTRTLIIYCK